MTERVTSVPIKRGLFALRYVRTTAPRGPSPTIIVRPAPGAERDVEVMASPDEREGCVSAPGGCVVVRAMREASLHVTIRSDDAGAVAGTELRLDPLTEAADGSGADQRHRQGHAAASEVATARASAELLRVELLGHVSRRGDLRVAEGGWIAGPDAPAPIEGIEARLVGADGIGADGVGLEYQVMLGGQSPSWTPWTTGTYAGSRGQSRPILAVRLRLAGPKASAWRIEAEALFLGASLDLRKGRSVELTSGSGVDPLVGLRLAVVAERGQVGGQAGSQADREARRATTRPARQDGPRGGPVRVFRASGLR